MAIKKSLAPSPQKKIVALENQCAIIDKRIGELTAEKHRCLCEITTLRLMPFNEGDKVLCEVTSGRTKKMQECVIEVDGSVVYVRPYKKDGELSDRRFSIIPIGGKTYEDYFQKV